VKNEEEQQISERKVVGDAQNESNEHNGKKEKKTKTKGEHKLLQRKKRDQGDEHTGYTIPTSSCYGETKKKNDKKLQKKESTASLQLAKNADEGE